MCSIIQVSSLRSQLEYWNIGMVEWWNIGFKWILVFLSSTSFQYSNIPIFQYSFLGIAAKLIKRYNVNRL